MENLKKDISKGGFVILSKPFAHQEPDCFNRFLIEKVDQDQ